MGRIRDFSISLVRDFISESFICSFCYVRNLVFKLKVVEPTPFAADDWAGLWNTRPDTSTGQYRVPFKFLDYPEENKVKVREHVQEFNRASCIEIVEVSEDDPGKAIRKVYLIFNLLFLIAVKRLQ